MTPTDPSDPVQLRATLREARARGRQARRVAIALFVVELVVGVGVAVTSTYSRFGF